MNTFYSPDKVAVLLSSLNKDLAECVVFSACSMNVNSFIRVLETAVLVNAIRKQDEQDKNEGYRISVIADYQKLMQQIYNTYDKKALDKEKEKAEKIKQIIGIDTFNIDDTSEDDDDSKK